MQATNLSETNPSDVFKVPGLALACIETFVLITGFLLRGDVVLTSMPGSTTSYWDRFKNREPVSIDEMVLNILSNEAKHLSRDGIKNYIIAKTIMRETNWGTQPSIVEASDDVITWIISEGHKRGQWFNIDLDHIKPGLRGNVEEAIYIGTVDRKMMDWIIVENKTVQKLYDSISELPKDKSIGGMSLRPVVKHGKPINFSPEEAPRFVSVLGTLSIISNFINLDATVH